MVCIVDPEPGNPDVARLDMQLLTPAIQTAAPGEQSSAVYRITNNDPNERFSGELL